MAHLLKERTFPSQYPDDAVEVLKMMTFSKGATLNIIGSASLRSQKYFGDYDGYEIVEGKFPTRQGALEHYAKEFQSIIKKLQARPNTHIGDIKAGVIEEWRVVPKKGYHHPTATNKVESLFQSKLISSKEARTALSLLKPRPSKIDILKAKDAIKFHIIRWKPEDILKGYVTLRNGRKYSLEEAFSSPTITKLDVVALVEGRYTEFAVIYEFHNGSEVLNPDDIDPERSLKDSIALLKHEGNLFKVVKRKFAIAKLKNDYDAIEKYHAVLNSDLGKLYVVYTDVKTLVELLEDNTIPKAKVSSAIKGFIYRLKEIYAQEDYLKSQKPVLSLLERAITSEDPIPLLRDTEASLLEHLSRQTKLRGYGRLMM